MTCAGEDVGLEASIGRAHSRVSRRNRRVHAVVVPAIESQDGSPRDREVRVARSTPVIHHRRVEVGGTERMLERRGPPPTKAHHTLRLGRGRERHPVPSHGAQLTLDLSAIERTDGRSGLSAGRPVLR